MLLLLALASMDMRHQRRAPMGDYRKRQRRTGRMTRLDTDLRMDAANVDVWDVGALSMG
jgi:hypothetical protein